MNGNTAVDLIICMVLSDLVSEYSVSLNRQITYNHTFFHRVKTHKTCRRFVTKSSTLLRLGHILFVLSRRASFTRLRKRLVFNVFICIRKCHTIEQLIISPEHSLILTHISDLRIILAIDLITRRLMHNK